MDTTPELANWPKDISMKTSGIPVMNSIIRNGIRNAPANIYIYIKIYKICVRERERLID